MGYLLYRITTNISKCYTIYMSDTLQSLAVFMNSYNYHAIGYMPCFLDNVMLFTSRHCNSIIHNLSNCYYIIPRYITLDYFHNTIHTFRCGYLGKNTWDNLPIYLRDMHPSIKKYCTTALRNMPHLIKNLA
jgi:hypothetical protein